MAKASPARKGPAPKRKPRAPSSKPAKQKAKSAAAGPSWFGRLWARRRNLRQSFEHQLSQNYGEERLLAYVALACVAAFLVNLPSILERGAGLDDAGQISNLAGSLIAYIFFAPLFLYGMAAVTHLIASRLFGGQGSYFGGRIALFWALILCIPIVVIGYLAERALVALDWPAVLPWISGVEGLAFLWIWTSGIAISEGLSRILVFLFVITAALCLAGTSLLLAA